MEKVVVNIEGSSDEVVKALQRLASLSVEQQEPKVVQEEWLEQDIREFWKSLTEGARAALRIVAKQPNGCPRGNVLKELGIKGNELAGRLSSVGHTMRKFKTKRRPFWFNEETEEYEMIPELSEAIIRLSL